MPPLALTSRSGKRWKVDVAAEIEWKELQNCRYVS
jgi:hypothetical protein